MYPFNYILAGSAQGAIRQLTQNPRGAFIAGGTTLLDLMKVHVLNPDELIDINTLALRGIERRDDRLFIGALETMSAVAEHPGIIKAYAVVSEALLLGASAQLRNSATMGGNLLQRTRCPYFRDTGFRACNKRDPGSGCAALAGVNKGHAILGGSDACVAVHASDVAVALAALDALVHVQGRRESRTVPVNEFYRLPADTPQFENQLAHGELIKGLSLPTLPPNMRSHYLKIRERTSYAFALVSVAGAVVMQNGRITSARLALGGVGTRPWRAYEAERWLIDQPATSTVFRAVADVALREATPLKDNGFKIELTKKAIVKCLSQLTA